VFKQAGPDLWSSQILKDGNMLTRDRPGLLEIVYHQLVLFTQSM
jgi:hypothetical protein